MATSEEILSELKAHRLDTRAGFKAVNDRLQVQGERLATVETKVTGLVPKVEKACNKANCATVAVEGIKGQWITWQKIAIGLAIAAIVGGCGWYLRSFVGG